MPELPDVEVFRRYLARTALRKRITAVTVRNTRILGAVSARTLQARLRGRQFLATRRHGKQLFVKLGPELWLVMHFGMTGSLKYFKSVDTAPAYDRLVFSFNNGYHLGYYSLRLLGKVDLTGDPDTFIAARKLGPDALSPRLTFKVFAQRLGPARGIVKAALMNQALIAGIGNIYSDEILFQARLHPQTRTGKLDERQLKKLYQKMRAVLKAAITAGAEPERLPRGYLIPRRHKGARCPRCRGAIRQLRLGGRSAYFCPQCQGRP